VLYETPVRGVVCRCRRCHDRISSTLSPVAARYPASLYSAFAPAAAATLVAGALSSRAYFFVASALRRGPPLLAF